MTKFCKNIIQGIYNLIVYFKIIWRDRQYDYVYIEYILLLKYKLMLKRMYSKDCPIDWTVKNQLKCRQALEICINILERRQSDFYTDIYYRDGLSIYQLDACENRDWKIYCNIISKYQNTWWD